MSTRSLLLRASLCLLPLTLLTACDGASPGRDGGADPGLDDGAVAGECEGVNDGTACGEARICVAGACVDRGCGDGFVDEGEECDDGNDVAFDGCEPGSCTFSCSEDADCADDDPCNGAEVCSDEHVCEAGDTLDDGAACSTFSLDDGVCRAEVCVPPGCGNGVVDGDEQCDDGNTEAGDGCEIDCTFSCEADADCANETLCDGAETCDPATHTCQAGEPIDCTPSDDCHTSMCDPETDGCVETLIDGDGDGFAPASLGACGTDCRDDLPDVHPDAEELCGDEIDNDCNGDTDENRLTWHADCDGDGFAVDGATVMLACSEPPASATGCAASAPAPGWTRTNPVSAADCDDTNGAIHPDAAEVAGNEVDDDCDGTELCFVDADGDGYRPDATSTVASSDLDCADAGEARADQPTGDCRDDLSSRNPGRSEIPGDEIDQDCDGRELCFRDGDNDGFRTTDTRSSSDTDCRDSGEARSIEPTGDCCDSDAQAHPGQSAWFDADDGPVACGGYDYDCVGGEQRRFTSGGSCAVAGRSCNLTTGWRTSVPSCGGSGSFVTSCEYDGELNRCFTHSTTRQQECH